MEFAQMEVIESNAKNIPKKEKKTKKEKTEKKNEAINSNVNNIIEEQKIKFNEGEILNIVKQHLYDKSERYKNSTIKNEKKSY